MAIRRWGTASLPRSLAAATVFAGFAVMLIVNLPGHLEFDSIRQLLEGQRAAYSNWHPPIMSWMLGVADAIVPGASPFVVFDAALAFGSIFSLLWLVPRPSWLSVAGAMLSVALPQLFLFQGIVWKDMLFADACLAGFVCLAHAAVRWKQPGWCFVFIAGAVALTALAVLTRQNGALVLPCAAISLGAIAAVRATWQKGLIYGAAFLVSCAALALGINAALQLRATKALGPVEELAGLQLYDIAGMLKRQPRLELPILETEAPTLAKLMREKSARLYSPVGQDALTTDSEIHGQILTSISAVGRQWRELVLAHPGTYLAVRALDFSWLFFSQHPDSCLTYAVGVIGPSADMKAAGLKYRYDDRDDWLNEDYAKPLVGTPLISHPVFAVAGLIGLFVLLRRRRPADIAMAGLLVATALYALSYFVISVSCEYRYLYAIDLSAIAVLFYLVMDFRWRADRS